MSELVVGVRIELRRIEPKIWRRVQVPIDISLTALHDIIQNLFNWEDYHLAMFIIREINVAVRDPKYLDYADYDSEQVALDELIDLGIKNFRYLYDFGDHWEHEIRLGKLRRIEKAMKYPVLLGGAGQAPPEDCGGAYSYSEFRDSLGTSYSDTVNDEKIDDPPNYLYEMNFDPEEFDKEGLQSKLRQLDFLLLPFRQ